MKYFRRFLTLIIASLALLTAEAAKLPGEEVPRQVEVGDSVEVSLLTCAPGREVYSLYGHTAIRYKNYRNGMDLVVNYGVFSFKKPFFILRFIFGLTDYEMGIMPFDQFCEEYEIEGRKVVQQTLNLTTAEKEAIAEALQKNYLPENRTYRYNYFYDNCTTRARDMILSHINGTVRYTGGKSEYPTYRQAIHRFNEEYPWARFGNDILLGVKADSHTSREEYQFLPFNLMNDFKHALIIRADGKTEPLVTGQSDIVLGGITGRNITFPLRPLACAWIFFAIVATTTAIELWRRKRCVAVDAMLMALDGCAGLLIFTMFFSQHPTTSTNLHILLLNPLPLFFIHRIVKKAKSGRPSRFWIYAIISIMAFLIGGFFQDYAEGTCVLALSLLVRCVWNIIPFKTEKC